MFPSSTERTAALARCCELIAALPDDEQGELLRLLASGDPNSRNEDDDTALHLTASPQIAEALLQAGANPDVHNNVSDTPLHNACDADNAELVRVLLRYGANPNAEGMTQQTPLFRTQSAEIAEMLLAAGADPNAQDVDMWVPLHGSNAEVTRVLLSHGADATVQDQANFTPLYWAEDPAKIRMLRGAGVRLCKEDFCNAALFHSQREGELEAWLAARGSSLQDMPKSRSVKQALHFGAQRDKMQAALKQSAKKLEAEIINDLLKSLSPEEAERLRSLLP